LQKLQKLLIYMLRHLKEAIQENSVGNYGKKLFKTFSLY